MWLWALVACTPEPAAPPPAAPPGLEAWCRADSAEVEAWIDGVLPTMTLDEQVAQLSGNQLLPNAAGRWDTPDDEVHDIPGFRMMDGPRGAHSASGPATAFPVAAARGATWDPALEQQVGEAIGVEAAAAGVNMLLAPTVNVLRHPQWGRAQETYGEDPMLLGAMGSAFVTGAQRVVLAQVKHFAVNSIEDTRFDVDVRIDDAPLHEVYLPHFRTIVLEAAAVMAAYNHVNGPPASESHPLLTQILREQWGYPGIVVSDWVLATETTEGAAHAGLDVEMPYGKVYGDTLREAVEDGRVHPAVVAAAVRRVLRTKRCFGLDQVVPEALDPSKRLTDAHLDLAERVAVRGSVLLHNDGGALPIAPTERVVVTGRIADVENIGDLGSSAVDAPDVVTAWEGLRDLAGARAVSLVPVDELVAADLSAADVVVVVAGLTSEDEGEGLLASGDRASLALRDDDLATLADVAARHDRVVVVLYGGSALTMPWRADVEAVLMAWYPGARGGAAIARLVYGDDNPSGRLPVTFPVQEADLPPFDNVSLTVTYDAFHGYRHLDRTGVAPLFPFGHGLSYTTFEVGDPEVVVADDGVSVTVDVTNTGDRDGIETIQVYVGPTQADPSRARRALGGFAQAELAAGASTTLTVTVPAESFEVYEASGWVRRTGPWTVEVGRSASAIDAVLQVDLP
jgi:beta-glucosidase